LGALSNKEEGLSPGPIESEPQGVVRARWHRRKTLMLPAGDALGEQIERKDGRIGFRKTSERGLY